MSKRQITIKPTCMHEILAFPQERSASLWEKINYLVSDPFPDGGMKKKLKGSDGIFRLRVGDFRVFYRFGDDWVSLLGLRRRREDTYDGMPAAGGEPSLPPEHEDDLEAALAAAEPRTFALQVHSASTALPVEITKDWLQALGVPVSAYPFLLRCKTEDDLLDAPIPSDVTTLVIDNIFPPSLKTVSQQPDLVVPSTEDLVRYKEGDLLGFLLRLDDDQKRLTGWALDGPTMVRGGAGTGKSTVALYRVKQVLERPGATGRERVLFTTYTRALITVTRQLLAQILSREQMERVTVATCDQIARDVVAGVREIGGFESSVDQERRLRQLRAGFTPTASSAFERKLRERALNRLSDRYVLEEFEWIIEGRGLADIDTYRETPRNGRGVPFPTRLRETVWELYGHFSSQAASERFPALRNEALAIVTAGRCQDLWDYVFVDEAQDLSPSALSLMAEVCRTGEGLFFAADSKQSLYSRNYTWMSAHSRLQFRGRSAVLRRNYRSTREIDRAAFEILQPEDGETLDPSTSVHEGPLPILVRGCPQESEALWASRFVRQMARHLHLRTSVAAVLVPSGTTGERMAGELSRLGLGATFFPGRDLDLGADTVKVLTLHSAKGLEFPIVVVCGFEEGSYPVRKDFDEESLFYERMRHERRLLYVGLTRAMRGLMLICPVGCQHSALMELDAEHWHQEVDQ